MIFSNKSFWPNNSNTRSAMPHLQNYLAVIRGVLKKTTGSWALPSPDVRGVDSSKLCACPEIYYATLCTSANNVDS